ncbi:MAG: hypothetical protein WA718_20295 [Terriglobales bacterium]
MNKSDNERVHELCGLIVLEQDPEKFKKLCQELNRILSSNAPPPQSDEPVEDIADGEAGS